MALQEVGVKLILEGSGGFFGELANANQAVDRFASQSNSSAQSAAGGFSSLEQIAIGGLRRIGEAAINGMAQAGMALVGFGQQSVSAAGEFEDGMNQFAAAAGGSLEAAGLEVEDFKQLFLTLGQELPVSTKEVQEAAIALVKGGIDPAIIAAGGLESSLQFAAAAGMGLEEAAELGVKMLGTFTSITDDAAIKTAFLAESQDLLVKAAGASTLNVEQLGDAMLEAGGQAKAVGLDYNEFVTTMGLISPAFKSAATAGTSFKNMLVRLQPSTTPAKDAMSELGLMSFNTQKAMTFLSEQGIQPLGEDANTLATQIYKLAIAQGDTAAEALKLSNSFNTSVFFDAEGQFIGMAEASQLLQEAFGHLSDADRIRTMQTIFGNDAMGAANALVDAGAAGYEEFARKMMEANGVAAQSAAVQQGLDFQMMQFQGSVESLQISLGLLLIPVLTELFEHVLVPGVNVLNSIVGAISGSRDAFDSLPGPIQALLAPFLGLSGALNSASDAVRNAAAPVLSLQNVLAGLPGPVGGAVTIIQDLIGAFMGDTAAMDRLPGTIRTLIGAASGVPGAIESARQAIDAFFNTPLGTAISDGAAALGDYLLNDFGPDVAGAIDTAKAKTDAFFNTPLGVALKDSATAVAEYFLNDFPKDLGAGIEEAETHLNRIAESDFGQRLQRGAQVVADYFTGPWPADFQRGLDLVMGAIEPWVTEAGRNWDAGMKAAGIFAEYMLNEWPAQFERGVQKVIDFVTGLKDRIVDLGPDFMNASKSIGDNIISGIIAGLDAASGGLFSTISGIIQSALGSAEKSAEIGSPSRLFAREIGRPITEGIAQGILQEGPEAVSAIQQLGAALLQGMSGTLEGGFTLREFSADLGLSAVDDLAGAVESQKPAAVGTAADFGEAIIGGISRGIRDKAHEAAQAAQDAANKALEAIGKALQIGSPSQVFADEVGMPISQGIAQGIIEGIDDVGAALDELGDEALRQVEGIAGQMGKLVDEGLSGQLGMIRSQQGSLDFLKKLYDDFYELNAQAVDLEGFELADNQLRQRMALEQINKVEGQLKAAQEEAARIGAVDPKAGADFLALRQRQIQKIIELENDYATAQRTIDRDIAKQKLELERQAQTIEIKQLQNSLGQRAQELEALGEEFKETGNSLVDGMIAGMQDRASEMATALKLILMEALYAAQAQLGIASPSLVFARQVGMPIAEGVAMGVNQAMPVALGAVNDMAQSLVRPAAPAVPRGSAGNSTTINHWNYSPNYNGAPRQPSQDFAALKVLSTAR
jgi:hypothetical protein